MDIVRVKMVDMSYNTGVWERKTIKTDFGLVSLDIVGWLIEDRADCLVVASEYQPDEEQFRHLIAIPKVNIRETTKLRKK